MVKILFHTEQLDVRGTCNAVYYYAHYNEVLLNNESAILTKKDNTQNDIISVERFKKRFKVLEYINKEDKVSIENLIKDYDIIYTIKYGTNDDFVFKNIKNIIHCVFDMSQPHGEVYAAVSETLAKKYNNNLFVPHMIGLKPSENKKNLREKLNIPENAIVFGRYGGLDTFNLHFVYNAILRIVLANDNIYFLFINTPLFIQHPHVIYLDKIIEDEDKNLFINTCDAHLECSTLGHTFGLSIGEFSVNNKPIICYDRNIWNRCHLDILGDKAILFKTEEEFYNIINTFDKKEYENKDLNCYKEYSPEKVIKKFEEIFIKSLV